MSDNAMRTLDPELTIYTVAQVRGQMLGWLAEGAEDGDFVLDAAGVADVDGAGVQLLAALARSLAAQQRTLRLAAPAPALREACGRLGLATRLAAGGAA